MISVWLIIADKKMSFFIVLFIFGIYNSLARGDTQYLNELSIY